MKSDYEQLYQISKSTRGQVNLVKRHSDQKVLILKELAVKGSLHFEYNQREVQICKDMMGELHFPKLVDHFFEDKHLILVQEQIKGTKLSDKINEQKVGQGFGEPTVVKWLTQVCVALGMMHERGVLHRDLKAQKIIIDNEDNVNFTGLGSVRFLDDKRSSFDEQSGTPFAIAPECLDFKNHTKASDVWQVGVLLYQLINCDFPFNIEEEKCLYAQIRSGIYNSFKPNNYSEELLDLVKNILILDPFQRPTIDQILQTSIVSNMRLDLYRFSEILDELEFKLFSEQLKQKIPQATKTKRIASFSNKILNYGNLYDNDIQNQLLKAVEGYDAITIIIQTNFNKKLGFIIPNKLDKDNTMTVLKNKPQPFTIENGQIQTYRWKLKTPPVFFHSEEIFLAISGTLYISNDRTQPDRAFIDYSLFEQPTEQTIEPLINKICTENQIIPYHKIDQIYQIKPISGSSDENFQITSLEIYGTEISKQDLNFFPKVQSLQQNVFNPLQLIQCSEIRNNNQQGAFKIPKQQKPGGTAAQVLFEQPLVPRVSKKFKDEHDEEESAFKRQRTVE